jgi:hypothetical protein
VIPEKHLSKLKIAYLLFTIKVWAISDCLPFFLAYPQRFPNKGALLLMEIARFSGQLAVNTSQMTRDERIQLHDLYNPQSPMSSGRGRSSFSSSNFGNDGWGPSIVDRPAVTTVFHLSGNKLTPKAIEMMRFLDGLSSKPAYAFSADDSSEVRKQLSSAVRPAQSEKPDSIRSGIKRFLPFLGS